MTSPYFFFLSGRCVKTEAATVRTFLELLFLRRSEAMLATRFDVFSFLPILGLQENRSSIDFGRRERP